MSDDYDRRQLTLWCHHCTATIAMPIADGTADITPADGWEITIDPERDVRCPDCAKRRVDGLDAEVG